MPGAVMVRKQMSYPVIVPTTPAAYAPETSVVDHPYMVVYTVPAVAFCTPDQTRLLAPYIRPAYTTGGYRNPLKGAKAISRTRFGRG